MSSRPVGPHGGGQISYREPLSICKAGRMRTSFSGVEGEKREKKEKGPRDRDSKTQSMCAQSAPLFLKMHILRARMSNRISQQPQRQRRAVGPVVSSTPLLTHDFIRPPTLEIKFTRHFMLLLFMSSTAAHFMGFCLPLQAHFRSPSSVLRCHLLLSFVLPKVFFFSISHPSPPPVAPLLSCLACCHK